MQVRSQRNSERARQAYQANEQYRERHKAAAKQSRLANKQRTQEWAVQYRLEHREDVNTRARKWYASMTDDERSSYAKRKYYKDAVTCMYDNAKARATRNNVAFTIAKEDVFIPDVCPVFGLPFVWGNGKTDFSPSLDRIDSSKGYEPGNVCVISWLANRLKSNATAQQLRQVCAYIDAHTVIA